MNENHFAVTKLCHVIRWASLLFLAIVFVVQIISLFIPTAYFTGLAPLMQLNLAGISTQVITQLSFDQRVLVALLSAPLLGALLWAFNHLRKLLISFERNDFFSRTAVTHLRAFAGWILVAKILAWLTVHLRVGVIGHMMADDRLRSKISLAGDDFTVLVLCVLFFLIARAMEIGQAAVEENKEFV